MNDKPNSSVTVSASIVGDRVPKVSISIDKGVAVPIAPLELLPDGRVRCIACGVKGPRTPFLHVLHRRDCSWRTQVPR